MKRAWILIVIVLTGCASLLGGSVRTFDAPVARVKPAMISTLASMGMMISSIERRGEREVLKARKADRSVEVEFERLGPASTRVRVTGSDAAGQIMRETEK